MHAIYEATAGNGYHCGCCRRDYDDNGDFACESIEDATKQMIDIAVESLNIHEDDWHLYECKIVGDEEIQYLDRDAIMKEAQKRYGNNLAIKKLKREHAEIVAKIEGYDRVFLAKIREADQQLADELITEKGHRKIYDDAGDAHNNATASLINRRTLISLELEELGA